jgi:streptogramin lyase
MIGARRRQAAGMRRVLALLLALTFFTPALGSPGPALAAPLVEHYSYDLSDMFVLGGFTAGPDGAQWFTNSTSNTSSQIGRLNTDGTISAFATYTAGVLHDLTLGPDGNLWATARHFYSATDRTNWIVRITPELQITSYPLPYPNSGPDQIVAGPDGALWFTESAGNRIGRITTAGALTEYAVPTPASEPTGIAAGADGALWFTERAGNRIARITTGGAITEFPPLDPGSAPTWIADGPDGRVWFSDKLHRRLGALAADGTPTYYPLTIPPPSYGNPDNTGPEALTTGPDGNLWVLVQQTHQIWRISPGGSVVGKVDLPFPDRPLTHIAPGPDGRVWYAKTGRIGAITAAGQVDQWQYGTFGSAAVLPTESGAIWLLRERYYGEPEQRLERILPNGFIERMTITGLPQGGRIVNPVLGPDETLWCNVVAGAHPDTTYSLGQIAGDGTLTLTPLPIEDRRPGPLVFGPDGNLWFFLYAPGYGFGQYESPYNEIARLTPGGQLTTFPVKDAFGIDSALMARSLTAGPDGNLWFIGPRSDQLIRITTAGQITEFTISPGAPNRSLSLMLLAPGPDGNIWFAAHIYGGWPNYEIVPPVLGKLTPDGQTTLFPLGTTSSPAYPQTPTSLVAGPDGNLWFTLPSGAVFHSITPDGTITPYWFEQFPNQYSTHFIAATSDSLWYLGWDIGRIRLAATSTLTTRAVGDGTVTPGGTYQTGEARAITATPDAGHTFVGWRVDGIYRGWSSKLTVAVVGPTIAEALFLPAATFADLPGATPAAVAARELASRGIIGALPPQRCQQLGQATPCFGAADPLDRLQGALMIAQSMPTSAGPGGPGIGPGTWRDITTPSSFPADRCAPQRGCIKETDWAVIGYMTYIGVVRGYGDGTFRPAEPLLNAHTISLISRAMVARGFWQPQPAPPGLFAGSVPAVHAGDVATYLHYVGAIPGAPASAAAWDGWLQPATRGWFAQTLWAALDAHWGAGTP